jgi:NADH:ubiquinone oxidoreductase subunit E
VTEEERQAVARALRHLGTAEPRREHLLPLVQAVQREQGWLSRGALAEVADRLRLPFPEVWGVATFYALLRLDPPRGIPVHVCDDVPCRLRGADALVRALEARWGPPRRFAGEAHGTPGQDAGDPAGRDWETVPCLGHCDGAPVAVVGGTVHRGIDAEGVARAAGGDPPA